MDAGRELDALVAERVMGERILWAHKVWSVEDWLRSDVPTEQNVMAIVTQDDENRVLSLPKYMVIPHYSIDIAAAWQVVEKMRGRFTSFALRQHLDMDSNQYRAGFSNNHFGPDDGWALAQNAPLAICLAALKAVGVEV